VLACQYEAFDYDVLENRVLREAVSRAAVVASDTTLRRRAHQLHEELSLIAPGPCPPPTQVAQRLQYDRRNEGYRTAHAWALVLLGGESIVRPFDDAGHASPTFLINMNRLFEQFVAWLFRRAYDGSNVEVREQARDRSLLWRGDARWGDVVPDIVLRRGNMRLAVDAKYKRYDLKRVSPGDLYQLFLYAQAYQGFGDTATALLVHPAEASQEGDRIELRVSGSTTASVTTIPLHLPQLLDRLRSSQDNRRQVLDDFRKQLKEALLET
jgi:5-methylcytosine-specific restriction enzyme subunit McrC